MDKIKLNKIDTRAPKKFVKEDCKQQLQDLKVRLGDLQNLLYAEGKRAILIVIQGMDASGKDGAVKNIFDAVNPLGCNAIPFTSPTPIEARHDFLWRIHQHAPAKGMIHIFIRSHYEDVLIQRVHKWVDEKEIAQRFVHINNFEKLLKESGTHVLKFYLHISKQEQLERLNERLEDPRKMWKYSSADNKERKHWDEYVSAYEDVFKNCSSQAPWHIVPSDQNWFKEFLIAKKVVQTLEELKLRFPKLKNP